MNEHDLTHIQVEAGSLLHTLHVNLNMDNDTLHSLRTHRSASVISEGTNTTTPESTPQRSSERIHITSHTYVADPQVEIVRQLEDLHIIPAEHQTASITKPTTDTNGISNRPRLSIQLDKLALPTFDEDITKFQQF
ncbi:hypothetical protein Y032_0081g1506 [Ancylostoma ceylanicum]|uniref:Uncharacterized protein n=1 Tax=Ancylostoma ceylanicum TaxID=53326 RepID=A0A016TTE3_9BILA|nr:hypothetical protein Y032_0081g1506 [Ancylostoma ceylanicum]